MAESVLTEEPRLQLGAGDGEGKFNRGFSVLEAILTVALVTTVVAHRTPRAWLRPSVTFSGFTRAALGRQDFGLLLGWPGWIRQRSLASSFSASFLIEYAGFKESRGDQ
jgi:hypothetical protein